MSAQYRMDAGRSRLTVQAYASGLLSFLAHSPTFAVKDFSGTLRWEPDKPDVAGLELLVRTEALELVDEVRPADREEIEGRMRREVLESDAYPEIRFQADRIVTITAASNRYRLRFTGALWLHGVTHSVEPDADLLLYNDGVRLAGEFPLRLSDYRIPPVTALGGAIKLRDQLRLSFDILAFKEES